MESSQEQANNNAQVAQNDAQNNEIQAIVVEISQADVIQEAIVVSDEAVAKIPVAEIPNANVIDIPQVVAIQEANGDQGPEEHKEQPLNQDTDVGEANTNINSLKFEDRTNNIPRLLDNGFVRNKFTGRATKNSYLEKVEGDKTIIFAKQSALKKYLQQSQQITFHWPLDESYLIKQTGKKTTLFLVDKKAQKGTGSVDIKLMASSGMAACYQSALGDDFIVKYILCLNEYLFNQYNKDTPKQCIYRDYLSRAGIEVLCGDAEDYFQRLDAIIGNIPQ